MCLLTDGTVPALGDVRGGTTGRPEQLPALKAALGEEALLWPCPGAHPVRLLDVLPDATPPRPKSGSHPSDHPRLPENLSCLYKTDLLLGGASLRPTGLVRTVLPNPTDAATAWVSATLKYRSRQVTAGSGLHLGIETAFTKPGRRSLTALVRNVEGMPVLTLPLDGAFVHAFNRANATLTSIMHYGLTRHPHPAHVPSHRFEQYHSWLRGRSTKPVVEVAYELLCADPALFTLDDCAALAAVELIAARGPERPPRPLAAVPQPLAS